MDAANWATQYAKQQGLSPQSYPSLDSFVSAMEFHFDAECRRSALAEMSRIAALPHYATTHRINPLIRQCIECGKDEREIHSQRLRCNEDEL